MEKSFKQLKEIDSELHDIILDICVNKKINSYNFYDLIKSLVDIRHNYPDELKFVVSFVKRYLLYKDGLFNLPIKAKPNKTFNIICGKEYLFFRLENKLSFIPDSEEENFDALLLQIEVALVNKGYIIDKNGINGKE